MFHSRIVVSTLPVNSVSWDGLCLCIKFLPHKVVAMEGWGKLSSVFQAEAVVIEGLVLVTSSGNEGDS